MRLGAVLGPFPGLLWVDLESRELVLKAGREGVAAEVRVPVDLERLTQTLEGLMELEREDLRSCLPAPEPAEPEVWEVLAPRLGPPTFPHLVDPPRRRPSPRPATVPCEGMDSSGCPDGMLVQLASKGRRRRFCQGCTRRRNGRGARGARGEERGRERA